MSLKYEPASEPSGLFACCLSLGFAFGNLGLGDRVWGLGSRVEVLEVTTQGFPRLSAVRCFKAECVCVRERESERETERGSRT